MPVPLSILRDFIISHFVALNLNFTIIGRFPFDRPNLCAISISRGWRFIFRCWWMTWMTFSAQFSFFASRRPKTTMLLRRAYWSLRTFCTLLSCIMSVCFSNLSMRDFKAAFSFWSSNICPSMLPIWLEIDALTSLKTSSLIWFFSWSIRLFSTLSIICSSLVSSSVSAISEGAFIRETMGELVAMGALGWLSSLSGANEQGLPDSEMELSLSLLENICFSLFRESIEVSAIVELPDSLFLLGSDILTWRPYWLTESANITHQ